MYLCQNFHVTLTRAITLVDATQSHGTLTLHSPSLHSFAAWFFNVSAAPTIVLH
jgi:hypothetical protein